MDIKFPVKKYNKSLLSKIVVAFLLACGAIFFSLYVSRDTLGSILGRVKQISEPNEKIKLVNNIFRKIVTLDQQQRIQALKPKDSNYNSFAEDAESLQLMLDTLRTMSNSNSSQLVRIDSMKQILYRRDSLYLNYMKLRSTVVPNDTLTKQVKRLANLIKRNRIKLIATPATTPQATVVKVDTLPVQEEKRTFWNKLFSKKQPKPKQPQKQVAEVMKVQVDTLTLHNRSDSIEKISSIISSVEQNRTHRRASIAITEQELFNSGATLISELLAILNDVEQTEMAEDARHNQIAQAMATKSIDQISRVFVGFIFVMAVLLFFILMDLSGSNKYRKQLIAAKEEAEEAGKVKQRFLANMSHELRTPLQIIIGMSEQVRRTPQPRRQDLDNIHQSSLHLLQIVNEVLDYSRIISGKFAIEPKPFNMHTLITEVCDMTQVQTAINDLTLHCSINIKEDINYLGDAFRLRQVLLNLLGNAVKFTEEGSISLTVTEEPAGNGKVAFTIEVADTGVGIPAADLAVIFKQFEQGNNLHQKPGTGLGLTIVQKLVELQGGTVDVASQQDKGTTFTVHIAYPTTTAAVENGAVKKVAQPSHMPAYKGHVWVVDDDVFILQLCSNILTMHGVAHTCFSLATKALQTPFPPDLGVVILDIRMADMDGFTLCKMLRQRQVVHQPLYIALTAQAMPYEQEDILKSGFDKLVMKPFQEHEFMNALIIAPVPIVKRTMPNPNLSSITGLAGGNQQTINTILRSFVAETRHDLVTVRLSLACQDNDTLAETLHKLASRVGQVQMNAVSQELRSIEVAIRNGNVPTNMETIIRAQIPMIEHALKHINGMLPPDSVAT